MRITYDLSDYKNKFKADGDYVEIHHDDHEIYVHLSKAYNGRLKFFLDFNGKILKSGYSIKPIITKLNKLGLEVK